jgi:alpha-glucosidase
MAHLPVLVAFEDGLKVAVTEADLRDYPGMYLKGSRANALNGLWPAYPTAVEQTNDRTVEVTERGDYLARTEGSRTYPWRVFVIAESDGDLIENTMVFRLAPPLQIEDPSWIRPGKVAWDWWNALNVEGVDFETGVNTATYEYFIDFAADHGIDYIILDEGWSVPADLSDINPDVDLDAILAFGRERGVGIILWVVWKSLEDRFEESLDQFEDWGVAGIKVDFMQRDDQPMVDYYWRVAEAAAERHLLVDFHGAYKPTGLRRAYPNVITREGVRGLEWSKWSEYPTPDHNVTLPFIRMLAGPMDFTPGAMINAQESQFHPVFDRPMSMGTRVHQLAMYVVFESPLQMLSDSPSNYLRELECLAFLSDVPTVWDETRVLTAQVGDWVAVARRRGDEWYVGAMTDWDARELELDLSFLGDGSWTATVFEDGVNASRIATDYRRLERRITSGERVSVQLAPGGGWAARFVR